MKYCVNPPVNSAIKMVPIPTPDNLCKNIKESMQALLTKIKSHVVLTFLTYTLRKDDKSLINPSKGINGMEDRINNAAPKLINTHPKIK